MIGSLWKHGMIGSILQPETSKKGFTNKRRDPWPLPIAFSKKNTLFHGNEIHIPPKRRLKSGSFGWPYVSSQERVYVVNGTCNSPSDKTTKSCSVAHGTPFSINQYIYPSIMWFHLFRTREKRLNQHVISGEFSSKKTKPPKTLGFLLVTFDDFLYIAFCWYHQLPSSENPLSQGFCRPAKAVHRDPLIDVQIWSIDPHNDVFVAGAGKNVDTPSTGQGKSISSGTWKCWVLFFFKTLPFVTGWKTGCEMCSSNIVFN